LVASGSIVALLHISGAYTVHALLFSRDQIAHLLLAWTLSFTAVCIFIFFSKLGDYSRIWLGGWYVSGLAISLAGRAAFSRLCRHWNKNGQFNRCAVLVGGGKAASELIKSLGKTKGNDVTIVGIFDDRSDERSPPVVNGYPRLGTVDELLQFARKVRIDLLLVTFPISAENRLLHVLRKLWVLPVDIRLSAHTQRLRYRPRAYSHIGHVAFLDLFDRPIAGWDALIKSTSDKMIALMAIVVLAPLLAAVWLAVRLDSKGPAIFKQKRYGFNNELIEVYKFRSMNCRNCSMSSEASCRWSALARMRRMQMSTTPSIRRSSKSTSPEPESNRESPAGRKSTAGAATPIRWRNYIGVWNMTYTISRTGRLSSI
jgi:hypothetical protein